MPQNHLKPTIILASSSKYRGECLAKICPNFQSDSPNIDETAKPSEKPSKLALRLSLEKAQAIASKHNNKIIIASDQTASCDGKYLNKPGSFHAAKQQLMQQSGKTVQFHTGLCLINQKTGTTKNIVETFEVEFKQLSEAQIVAYLKKDEPFDCAGSFKSESLGIALFKRMQGNDFNTLIGLPLIQLSQWLEEEGLDPLLF